MARFLKVISIFLFNFIFTADLNRNFIFKWHFFISYEHSNTISNVDELSFWDFEGRAKLKNCPIAHRLKKFMTLDKTLEMLYNKKR